MIGYDYVGLTITFAVIGQLLSKWQMGSLTMPEGTITKLNFLSSRPVPPPTEQSVLKTKLMLG